MSCAVKGPSSSLFLSLSLSLGQKPSCKNKNSLSLSLPWRNSHCLLWAWQKRRKRETEAYETFLISALAAKPTKADPLPHLKKFFLFSPSNFLETAELQTFFTLRSTSYSFPPVQCEAQSGFSLPSRSKAAVFEESLILVSPCVLSTGQTAQKNYNKRKREEEEDNRS